MATTGSVRLIELRLAEERAHVSIGPDEAGGVEDPALNQHFKLGELSRLQGFSAPQSMQIAVCIKAQLRRTVIAVSEFLAGIAQRLEVSYRLWMLQGCHDL